MNNAAHASTAEQEYARRRIRSLQEQLDNPKISWVSAGILRDEIEDLKKEFNL